MLLAPVSFAVALELTRVGAAYGAGVARRTLLSPPPTVGVAVVVATTARNHERNR